ncbi:carboxypeptidase-like regulatory domain-containing protein [Euzebyella saccharophila]|uniref:Carboxypeptidase-like regulatory domain-containing protein n=1 Tax=Euzebyella saccharophila TaxID=679664 RepID=A0ABV8JJC6_9FLAO|nr:carboxypeptidase-like regulatory domain-containing protein [Euzebyella saccharophila]
MSYLKCLLILLIGFSTITLYAQEENFLRGRVYETTSNIPIVYATVRIKGKAKGVITNMDGGFRLPKNLYQLGDTIQVSSMGYQLTNFPISKLSPSEINIIRLPTTIFSLDEAVVSAKRKKRLTARQIVKKAIERIPINYLTSGFSQKGYSRDYQLDSEVYLNLNEAILEVYDPGFDYNDSNYSEVSIYESRLNEAFKRNDRAAKAYDYLNYEKIIDKAFLPSYGGNEFLILRVHDAIRNFRVNSFDYVNVLNDGDLVANHSFRKFHETSLGDEKLYKIGLIRRMEDFRALGTIYISKNDFAIHKLEYAVFDRTFEGERSVEEYQKEGKLIFEVITEYKRGRNNKMELNFISFHNNFTLAAPSKFIIEEVVFRPDRKAI